MTRATFYFFNLIGVESDKKAETPSNGFFSSVVVTHKNPKEKRYPNYSLTLADIPGRLFSEREEPYLQGLSSRWNREEDENNEPQCQVKR